MPAPCCWSSPITGRVGVRVHPPRLHFDDVFYKTTQQGLDFHVIEGHEQSVFVILHGSVHRILLCVVLCNFPVVFSDFFQILSCQKRSVRYLLYLLSCAPGLGSLRDHRDDMCVCVCVCVGVQIKIMKRLGHSFESWARQFLIGRFVCAIQLKEVLFTPTNRLLMNNDWLAHSKFLEGPGVRAFLIGRSVREPINKRFFLRRPINF